MGTIYELLARAAALREETALNSISPERAGGIMYDTIMAINELWLQQGSALVISKIYTSVSAMEADDEPVSDISGQPLRAGQIVVIASSDSDNGSVYRFGGISEGASVWAIVGLIGNITPVDALDSDSTQLPLAAHQGKVLDGKISQLGQQVDGLVTKNITWTNGWINTRGLVASSSQSIFSQPFLLKAGEKVTVGTANSNICIIGTTSADSISVEDTITVIQTTSTNNFETYEYVASQDIKIVVCVKSSDYSLSFYDTNNLTEKVSKTASKEEVAELFDTNDGVEYYEASDIESGKYINKFGTLATTTLNTYGLIYIDVKKGDVVVAKIASASNVVPIAFGKAEEQITYTIGRAYNDYYDSTTTPATYRYDVEEDGVLVVSSNNINAVGSSIIVYSNGKIGTCESNSERTRDLYDAMLSSKFVKGKNLFDQGRKLDGYYYIDSKGEIVADTANARQVYDFIRIEGGKTYTASAARSNYSIFFYNQLKNYIGNYTGSFTDGSYTFVAPEDAYYVRFQISVAYTPINPMLELGGSKTEYEPYNYQLPALAEDNGINVKHRLLIIGLSGDVNTNRVEEDLFRVGFLCEVCSFETFINEHNSIMDDYDAIIVSTMNLPYDSVMPLDLYNALYAHKGKRIIFFANPYAYASYSLGFRKLGYAGTPADPSVSVNYKSIIPFFDESLTPTYHQISSPNLEVVSNGDYDLVASGMKILGGTQAIMSVTGGSESVKYPAKIVDGNNTYYPAFVKDNIAVVFDCGLSNESAGGNVQESAGWKYIDYAKLLMYMFGIDTRDRLAMDSAFGKRMFGIGVDGDETNDFTASKDLISSVAPYYPLEFGFVTGNLTESLADKYRYLKSKFQNLEYASHTYSHYGSAAKRTVSQEQHTIDEKGFVILDCNSMVVVSSVNDDQDNAFTIVNTPLDRAQPTTAQCAVQNNQYGNCSGVIKFNRDNIGKTVFVDYTYIDDTKEAYGSIKNLESLGIVTDKSVYLTIGLISVNGVTFEMCDNEDISMCDYVVFPSFRDAFVAKQLNKPLPPFLAVTMCGDGKYGSPIVDANITRRQNGPTAFQNTEMPNCVAYCKSKELPYVSYYHDFVISTTAPNGVWLDSSRAAWKQETAEATVAFLQQNLYKFVFDYVNSHDVVKFLTRGEVCRRYSNMNKFLEYDIKRTGDRIDIYVKSNCDKVIKGVTFKLPVTISGYNNNYVTILPNNSGIYTRYDSTNSELVLWTDVAPGIKHIVICLR